MATMYIFFAKLIDIFKISIPSSFEYLNFRAKNGKNAPPFKCEILAFSTNFCPNKGELCASVW